MPVIHERSDRKFYITQKPKRSGQYITWQMKEHCAEYLKKYSLLSDNTKIRSYTVILLRLLGYVFTNNKGYEEIPPIAGLKLPADFQSLSQSEKALIKELRFLLQRAPKVEKKEEIKPVKVVIPAVVMQSPNSQIPKEQEIFNKNKKSNIAGVNCQICKKRLGLFEKCCLSLEKQIFVCSICGSEENFDSVLCHMMRHGREYCVFCRKFILTKNYNEHFINHLTPDYTFCFDCNEQIHKKSVESHIAWHRKKSEPTFSGHYFCAECGEHFKKSQIRMHINLVHRHRMSKYFFYLGAISFKNMAVHSFITTRSEIISKKLHLKPLGEPIRQAPVQKSEKASLTIKKADPDKMTCPLCRKAVIKTFYRQHLRLNHGVG